MAESGKDREAAIKELMPKIGFITEGKITAEKERVKAVMFDREADRQARQRERVKARGIK